MREIKFRAWDTLIQRLRYDIPLDHLRLDADTYDLDINKIFKYKNLLYMQYTGLKDKNGVEIYEGDILLERGDKFDWYRPVVWHDASWAISIGKLFNDAPDRHNPLHFANTRMEVIGNIYENPELLETN